MQVLLHDLSIDDWEDYIPKPPDGGWAWIILVASFFNNFILDGITYCFGVFLAEYADYFNASVGATSFASALLCGFNLIIGRCSVNMPFIQSVPLP